MSNSPLISYTELSPNQSGRRKHAIDTISIHCMAGNLSVESCGHMFSGARKASSNYGIGSDGRIGLYVEEKNCSWCTSSPGNDNRAVTIEVANTVAADPWPVSDKAYAALIDLLTDICQRNGITRLLWRGDKNLIGQVDKQNMTVHRWFAAKACPGDWLYERHGEIADAVNKRLDAGKDDEIMDQATFDKMMDNYLNRLAEQEPSDWSEDDRRWAEEFGIIYGDESGKKMYRSF
ncbi:MAG: peptidoglycan recognition family protein, partial [Oscillospiraceae bacterium]